MKRYLLIIGFSLCLGSAGFAQLGTPLTLYSSNQIVYNPGYSGFYDMLSFNLSARKSWIRVPGAPSIINFNGHAPFSNKKHSFGWVYQYENWGNLNGNQVYGNYSYKIFLGYAGTLSLGLQAGVLNHLINWDKLTYVEDYTDPTLGKGVTSSFAFDANVGAYFLAENWYLGVSAMHLPHPKYGKVTVDGKDRFSRMRTHYFFMAGYNHYINYDWAIQPEIFVRYVKNTPISVNLGAHLYYMNRIGGGITFMSGQGTVNFNFKFNLNEQLRVGYSYGIAYGAIKPYEKGSHELSVSYSLDAWGGTAGSGEGDGFVEDRVW